MSNKKQRRQLRRKTKQEAPAPDVPWTEEEQDALVTQVRQEKKARKVLSKTPIEEVTTLDTLCKHLALSTTDWDYLIVGDGSGTTWEKEFGWGSVLVSNHSFERQVFFGAMSNGTNNMAELLMVLHPLMHIVNNDKGVRANGTRVHIVSDSQYVVNGLAKDNPIWVSQLQLNRELWMAIHMTRRSGLIIKGHHIPRDTIDLNRLGHDLANISRKRMIGILSDLPHDIYAANPDRKDDGRTGANQNEKSSRPNEEAGRDNRPT